jgi:hypothetical protein
MKKQKLINSIAQFVNDEGVGARFLVEEEPFGVELQLLP